MYRKTFLAFFIASFSLNAYSQDWQNVCYYDTTGTKNCGLIKWNRKIIWFKKTKEDEKIQLDHYDIKSYVIGADSFIVSKNAILEGPYLKVLINNPVKLYELSIQKNSNSGITLGVGFGGTGVAVGGGVMGTINSSGRYKKYYYYGKDPETVTKLTNDNFIEAMSEILENKPEVVINIKNKKLRLRNLGDITEYCKTGFWPDNKQHVD